MDIRAYLNAKRTEAEIAEELRREKLDRILSPMIVIGFWGLLIGAWLLR